MKSNIKTLLEQDDTNFQQIEQTNYKIDDAKLNLMNFIQENNKI